VSEQLNCPSNRLLFGDNLTRLNIAAADSRWRFLLRFATAQQVSFRLVWLQVWLRIPRSLGVRVQIATVSCNLDEQAYVTGRESDSGEGRQGLKFDSLFCGSEWPAAPAESRAIRPDQTV
jgi:hypothetical protein